MASRTLLQKGHASNSNNCKGLGGPGTVISPSFKLITDLEPHGSLAKVDTEEVATSKASFLWPEGSPPEKSLSKGQSTDKKLVDGPPPPCAFGAEITGSSESADFAWDLVLGRTHFPFIGDSRRRRWIDESRGDKDWIFPPETGGGGPRFRGEDKGWVPEVKEDMFLGLAFPLAKKNLR